MKLGNSIFFVVVACYVGIHTSNVMPIKPHRIYVSLKDILVEWNLPASMISIITLYEFLKKYFKIINSLDVEYP